MWDIAHHHDCHGRADRLCEVREGN
jgi:hypothetical protein